MGGTCVKSPYRIAFAQHRERILQPIPEFLVGQPDFDSKSVDCGAKGSQEFFRSQLLYQCRLKWRGYFLWQSIDPAPVGSRKGMADASQRESMVADTANHVFGLPQTRSRYATPCVKRIQPSHADDVTGSRRGTLPRITSRSENEPEGRRHRPEFRRWYESQIDLQSIGKKKYAVKPRPAATSR